MVQLRTTCSWGKGGKVFATGPGDRGSIPGRVMPKTLKMVLDTSLFNNQQYKVLIEGKVEQSRERSYALPYTSVLQLLKREPSGRLRLRSQTWLTDATRLLRYRNPQHANHNDNTAIGWKNSRFILSERLDFYMRILT